MSSTVPLIAPVILPMTAAEGGYAAVADHVQVTLPDPAVTAFGVAITVTPFADGKMPDQTLPDGTKVPLDTLIAPVLAVATFLPANTPYTTKTWTVPFGPLPADAWVLQPQPDTSRPNMPSSVPEPGLYVLQGVAKNTVADPGALLDQWLNGQGGVKPQVKAAQKKVPAGQAGATQNETWRNRMLAGSFGVSVPAGTVLGRALGQGTSSVVTLRVLDRGGTEIPASGVLEAMAALNQDAMKDHPVVTQAKSLAAGLPVRMYLRFDAWDVLGSSKADPKGTDMAIQPDQVSVIDPATGDEIASGTWTISGQSGVLAVDRKLIEGRTFALQPHFLPGVQIALERGTTRRWPASPSDPLIWSTVGWTARDGQTPGTWTQFSGIQIGSATAPMAFRVGVKVRLALSYQEQARDGYGNKKGAPVQTRRVAPGHQVSLYTVPTTFIADATFTTDTDGEVSGVAFQVAPGSAVGVAIERRLAFGQTEIRVRDEPGSGDTLYPNPYFYSSVSSPQVFFLTFTAGALEAKAGPLDVVIGADPSLDKASTTPDAAAFHALKFARFAHEGIALLGGNPAGMPAVHEFQVTNGADGAGSTVNDDPVTGTAITTTHFPPKGWFTRRTVIHEYGHGTVRWLSGSVRNSARRTDVETGYSACVDEFKARYGLLSYSHNEWMITTTGLALTEGLTLCFETFFGEGTILPPSGKAGPSGQQNWPRYIYTVSPPVAPPPPAAPGPVQLSVSKGREVEGVFANALFDYVNKATGFAGFALGDKGDSATHCTQPQEFIATWQAGLPASDRTAKLDQLHRLVRWLLIDPISSVVGDKRWWSGRYPAGAGGVPTTKVYDILLRVFTQNPTAPPTPEESFSKLHNDCLVQWNLEQIDPKEPNPPLLGLDW